MSKIDPDKPVKKRGFFQRLAHPRLPVFLVLLMVLLTLPSFWNGLMVDDYFHRARAIIKKDSLAKDYFSSSWDMFHFTDGNPANIQKLIDKGLCPWWTSPEVRLSFFRPVTAFTHLLDYQLWPDHPALMHLHNIIWFAGVVLLLTILYKKICGAGWVSGLAALLFVLDDAHAMPVSWIANRNMVISLFFGLLVLLWHHRWSKEGDKTAGILAHAALILSLLANEGGIATIAYLFSYALFLERGLLRKRLFSLVPYGLIIVIWRTIYSILGYGAANSAAYIDPVQSPFLYIQALFERFPLLLSGQLALPPPDIFLLLPPIYTTAAWVFGILFILLFLFTSLPLLRKDPVSKFWALGMLLSIVPVCAVFPMDRLLLFAGIGAMGLVAAFIAAVKNKTLDSFDSPGKKVRYRLSRVFFYFLITIHLFAAPLLLPLRITSAGLAGKHFRESAKQVSFPAKIEERTVVLVNAPTFFHTIWMPLIWSAEGLPYPGHLRTLAPLMPSSCQVTRDSDRSLVYQPRGGYTWILLRGKNEGFHEGDTVKLKGMQVEILTVDKKGIPQKVRFHFDRPLEDPGLLWYIFRDGQYRPFDLPEPGTTITIEPF